MAVKIPIKTYLKEIEWQKEPVRIINAFKALKLHTLEDLLQCGVNKLLTVKNFGRRSLVGVNETLIENGYDWESCNSVFNESLKCERETELKCPCCGTKLTIKIS